MEAGRGDPTWSPEPCVFARTLRAPVRTVVAASRGLEPPTHALGKRRSVQLSYEAVMDVPLVWHGVMLLDGLCALEVQLLALTQG